MSVHEAVLYVAIVWLAVLLGTMVFAVTLPRRSPASRILALDMLILMLVGLLVVFGALRGAAYYLDAALVLALLAFVASLAASRLYDEGSPW